MRAYHGPVQLRARILGLPRRAVAIGVGGLAVAGLAIALALASGDEPRPAPTASLLGGRSEVPLGVGQQAPRFTLSEASGDSYEFRPGDDKVHLFVFYMGYFCGACRVQLGDLAERQELRRLGDVVAVSSDPLSEGRKMDQLLNGSLPLLLDHQLTMITPYHMRLELGGGEIGSNMGYVVVDGRGVVRKWTVDPLFGSHLDAIIQDLEAAQSR